MRWTCLISGVHMAYIQLSCVKTSGTAQHYPRITRCYWSASAIALRYDTTGRIRYLAGNALEDDLGTSQYDVIMINNVVHHFTAEQNKALAKKNCQRTETGRYLYHWWIYPDTQTGRRWCSGGFNRIVFLCHQCIRQLVRKWNKILAAGSRFKTGKSCNHHYITRLEDDHCFKTQAAAQLSAPQLYSNPYLCPL